LINDVLKRKRKKKPRKIHSLGLGLQKSLRGMAKRQKYLNSFLSRQKKEKEKKKKRDFGDTIMPSIQIWEEIEGRNVV
jgi:hypothetical protein